MFKMSFFFGTPCILEQQLFHAIKNRHFATYYICLTVKIPNVRGNNFKGMSWIL